MMRWSRLRVGLAVAVAAVTVTGCREPNFPATSQIYVEGNVTASAGFPAEGASVVFEVHRAADGARVGSEPATANAQGRYATLLAVLEAPFDARLTVRASWEFAGSGQERTLTDIPARFRRPRDGIDSLRIDITLQPVSGSRARQ